MKTIIEYLQNKQTFDNAKNNCEPFVKAALEEDDWTVEFGTEDKDFGGINLKATRETIIDNEENERPGGTFTIDVKDSTQQNQNSKSFLFTTVSDSGKPFAFKKNNYFAFIDREDKTIALTSHDDVKNLVANYSERQSKSSENGKYVLIPKQALKKLSRIINPSNNVKRLLK